MKLLLKAGKKLFGKMRGRSGQGDEGETVGDGVTPQQEHKHERIADQAAAKLTTKEPASVNTYDAFFEQKKKKAKAVENEFNPKLGKRKKGKPVKMKVKCSPKEKDKKDNDVDMTIEIAPNMTTKKLAAKLDALGDTYPGSGINPDSRSIHQLWEDLDSKKTLRGENGNDIKSVSSNAYTEERHVFTDSSRVLSPLDLSFRGLHSKNYKLLALGYAAKTGAFENVCAAKNAFKIFIQWNMLKGWHMQFIA